MFLLKGGFCIVDGTAGIFDKTVRPLSGGFAPGGIHVCYQCGNVGPVRVAEIVVVVEGVFRSLFADYQVDSQQEIRDRPYGVVDKRVRLLIRGEQLDNCFEAPQRDRLGLLRTYLPAS